MSKIAVIGRGLIGSAAARHLALGGHDVVLIGPGEPQNRAMHSGVFASHYDEGRITRALDPDPFWARVTHASIARYADIRTASGVDFHTPCGGLLLGTVGDRYLSNIETVQKNLDIPAKYANGDALSQEFPFFHFTETAAAFYETAPAGYVSARNLVRAQGIAFTRAGGVIQNATLRDLRETNGGVNIQTDQGDIDVDQVLVCAGGYTQHLLDIPVEITPYARTVAYFEIDDDEAARLFAMPTLITNLGDDTRDYHAYLLPPIKYPNGKTYLKIGGDRDDVALRSTSEINTWFGGNGRKEAVDDLTTTIMDLMPSLCVQNIESVPCITTFTSDDKPFIARISNHISIATAGCGRGAKCSDELGRMGAALITDIT